MDLPSRLDLYSVGRSYVLQRANKIDPFTVDVEGSDVNIFVGSASVVGDKIVKQLGYSIARLFLDGAFDEDLDRLAFDRYGLTRKGASAALGNVSLSRASFANGAGTIPSGTVLLSTGGFEYITTQAATFGASVLTGVTANVRASQAGKAPQASANQLTKFKNPSSLFDPTIQVNNPASTAGGEDVEDDDTFKNRVRDFWNTARRGVLAAIEFGALTVPGVVSAQASEVLTGTALPARVVNLYISDSTGVASQALASQVQQALLDYRAAGIAVLVSTSIPQIVPVQLALTFQSGVDTVTLSQLVAAAVVGFINSLPVNGPLYLADLYSVLQRFAPDGLVITQSTVIAPAGDIIPAVGQTLRTTITNVTFTTTSM